MRKQREPDLLGRRALTWQSVLDFEAQEVQELGFYPRAFCQIGLPISPFEGNEYNKDSGLHHLSIMAPRVIGVPWGIYPRGIMAWMVTEVVKRKKEGEASRTLNLGNNLLEFMSKVTGTNTYSGGKNGNIQPFKRQLASLLASRILYWYGSAEDPTSVQLASLEVASAGTILWAPKMVDSPGLFQSTITLGEAFWNDIMDHAVPIDYRALQFLWPSCLGVDMYVWMTYRAGSLLRQKRNFVFIPWSALQVQFGSQYSTMRSFRQEFLKVLANVNRVFPSMEFREEEGSASDGPRQKGMVFKFKRPSIMSVPVPQLPAGTSSGQ